jgi:hypothetical protein
MPTFVECESVNVSYSEMGLATVTYTKITTDSGFPITNSVTFGGHTFEGVVMSALKQPIPDSENSEEGVWYTINVTMIALK